MREARGVGETGNRAVDLQGAAIGWKREILGILYGNMLDISEVGRRWENVAVLYGKMADFSDHLLEVVRINSAGMCW